MHIKTHYFSFLMMIILLDKLVRFLILFSDTVSTDRLCSIKWE